MSEPHPSHKTVAVLTAFTTAVIELHIAIREASRPPEWAAVIWWGDRAYDAARSAVRAARCLTVREEYR